MNYSLLRGSCTVVQEHRWKDGANPLCRGAARTRSLTAAKIQTKNRTAKAIRNIFSVIYAGKKFSKYSGVWKTFKKNIPRSN